MPEGIEKDNVRDEYLKKQGYVVLRYTDSEVNKNFEGVCQDLILKLK